VVRDDLKLLNDTSKNYTVALTFGLATVGLTLTCMAAADLTNELTPFTLNILGSIITGLAFYTAAIASYP
jgi:hypothetical protein